MDQYFTRIQNYLSDGNVDEAQKWIAVAELSYVSTAEETAELAWLKAESAALSNDMDAAIQYGSQAVDAWIYQGALGVGTYGTMPYAQYMFRRQAMAMELVPQLTLLPMPEVWVERTEKLIEWCDEAGKNELTENYQNTVDQY